MLKRLIAVLAVAAAFTGLVLAQPQGVILGSGDSRVVDFIANGTTYLRLAPGGVLSFLNGATMTVPASSVNNAALTGIGSWTDVAYSAGNFTANNSMTWTVQSGDQLSYRYALVGNTMMLQVSIASTTVAGTPDTELRIGIPGGLTGESGSGSAQQGACHIRDNNTYGVGLWSVADEGTYVAFYKADFSSAWAAATDTTAIRCSMMFRVE